MSFVKKTYVLRLKHETNVRFNPNFCRELIWQGKARQGKERAETSVEAREAILLVSDNRQSAYGKVLRVNRECKAINEKSPIGVNRSGFFIVLKQTYLKLGTSGRTRTATLLRARDFESLMSTNFITLAR